MEKHIHEWKCGLKIFKNENSKEIREGCKKLLQELQESGKQKWHKKFRENLIDCCIWKYSSCEFVFSVRGKNPNKKTVKTIDKNDDDFLWGDKYAARFFSEKAWNHLNTAKSKCSINRSLRFDHVWERKDLRREILNDVFNPETTKKFIGCVVFGDTEHNELIKDKEGWARYEGKTIWKIQTGGPCKYRVKNGKLKEAP
jgi:hypothetical protein